MARKHKEEKEPNQERWLLTYADLITLLMIFFVVLYALSTVDVRKFQSLSNSLRIAFGGGRNLFGEYEGTGMVPIPIRSTNDLEVAQEHTDAYISRAGLEDQIKTSLDERGLVITLNERTLFEPGSADVLPAAKQRLAVLAKLLSALPNYIRIEGFADDLPSKGANFRSNWELSAVRATNVVQTLLDNGLSHPDRVSAIGYGQYRPLADNTTIEGRAKNRRVEIVILNSRYNATEANSR
ncbi:MAG TPA: flagellar motor protein MotB [bacterium]|nr:flagellar motor protein MotB [bacterium]